MQKTGGIIAVIAGGYGEIASVLAMSLGSGDMIVARAGWGGIVCCFVTIVLGAIAVGCRSRVPGILLIAASLIGLVWIVGWLFVGATRGTMSGGAYIGISMIFSLLGGVLVTAANNAD